MSDSNEKHKWYLDDARLRQLLTWITGKISSSIPTMTEFTKEEIEVLWNNRLSGTVTPGTSSFSFRINGYSSVNGRIITVTPDSAGNWSWDNVEGYEITSTTYMFYNCTNLTSLDVSGFDTSSVTNMFSMFRGCTELTSLDVSSFDTSSATSINSMFYSCPNLTSLDVSSFDTSSVIDMNSMFSDCTRLTSLDVSSFDTSSVVYMVGMFLGCTGLTSLDLTSWYTKNITTYYSSFVDNVNTLTINYKSVNWNSDIPTSFANVHWIDVA